MDETWTIAELAQLAADALASTPQAAPSRRVREAPNERLIRWYATVGLIDPPLSRRGRVAWYGRRHLLQLVAVKRRQAEGRALAEIQVELAGATDRQLASIAGVFERSAPAPSGPAEPVPLDAGPARFWARPATGATPALGGEPALAVGPVTAQTAAQAPSALPAPLSAGQLAVVRISDGVVLLLEDAGRDLGPGDLATIRDAAAPLLATLARLGLAGSPHTLTGMPGADQPADPATGERKPT